MIASKTTKTTLFTMSDISSSDFCYLNSLSLDLCEINILTYILGKVVKWEKQLVIWQW
jgi:hypothetical protein